jgi:hypothetical protein
VFRWSMCFPRPQNRDLYPKDEDQSLGTPNLYPKDEDQSLGTPVGHPSESWGSGRTRS